MILIQTEDAETLYKNLAICNAMYLFAVGDNEKYMSLMTSQIIKEVGQLIQEKKDLPLFEEELFKSELTAQMNLCLENEEIYGVYGKLWLAKDSVLVEIITAIADAIAEGLNKLVLEEYQAQNN